MTVELDEFPVQFDVSIFTEQSQAQVGASVRAMLSLQL